jgi:hypothetical protein
MTAVIERTRHTFSRHHPRRRVIQYSEASVMDPKGRGVLDRPVKPDDDS